MNAVLKPLSDTAAYCPPIHRADSTVDVDLFRRVADLVYQALLVEVHLTPKPGLVDQLNNGAHRDMDVPLFERSAAAIRPYIMKFLKAGFAHRHAGADDLLVPLRPIGIQAEKAMFQATGGVNTHKGIIFSFGLICGAVGWLSGKRLAVDPLHISHTIKRCCALLVTDELKLSNRAPQTHGEKLFHEYGLTGARGEAASGFQTILKHSLPALKVALDKGYSTRQGLWQSLLVLMAYNQDTNVVSRGGMHGLRFVQHAAHDLLERGGCELPELEQQLIELDVRFTARRLSPGGSADLLAMTWFLAQLDDLSQHCVD